MMLSALEYLLMKLVTRFAVDIDDNCLGQEFTITRMPCFISGTPIAIVQGMGLVMSYVVKKESDIVLIRELLATVQCRPRNIRPID